MRPALTGWARMRRAAITRLLLTAALSSVSFLCHAEGTLLKVPTREGVTTTLFWEPAPNAKATVFLFPGGGGGFGKVEDGKAIGQNFLVRSEPFFIANGFNVAIFGRPSDSQDLDYADRISDTHMADAAQGAGVRQEQSRCAGLDCWHQPGHDFSSGDGDQPANRYCGRGADLQRGQLQEAGGGA